MAFNLEHEIASVVKRPTKNPNMRDPYKEKLKDHRNRNKGFRFGKRRKSDKKLYHRSLRKRNNQFCKRMVDMTVEEIGSTTEPIYK